MKLNQNYFNVSDSYLFSDIAKKVAAYQAANPQKKVLRLGIGDVTLPLAPAVVAAMRKAAAEIFCIPSGTPTRWLPIYKIPKRDKIS